jgi:signal transduction histidine kinase/putative methionine-R-sulfoxide reductase with GAF domain
MLRLLVYPLGPLTPHSSLSASASAGTGNRSGFVFSFQDITTLKRNEGELKHRTEQLIALHEISARMTAAHDTGDLLRSVIPPLLRALDASAVLVYLTDQTGSALLLAHHEGMEAEKFTSIKSLNIPGSVTGDAVTRKRAEYISAAAYDDPRISELNRDVLRRGGLEAMAIIPLLSKDRVIGALDIFYLTPHSFSDEEKNILTLVGNQLGTTIENAHLYAELSVQIGRLTVLFDLSRTLSATLRTDEIHRALFEHVRSVLPCRTFSVRNVDEKEGWSMLKFRAAEGSTEEVSDAGREQFPASPSERLVASERRSAAGDSTGDLVVPMMIENRIAGLITAGFDEPVHPRDIRLLESIGNLAALALDKADLYEETVRISDQIARRNRELDDFTYVVSHDLKEPLISIEGFSRILLNDYTDSLGSEGKEYLGSLVGASTRMKGLIDDLLQLSRVSQPAESFARVSVGDVVGEILTDMEFVIRTRNVRFTIDPGLPDVFGNRTQMKILFRNLIGNAVKFNDKEQPHVEIGFINEGNNSYLFRISDNGIGIERDFYDKIFVIFQRLHTREEYEGSGAGLAIVKKIMEVHGGTIRVESEPGKGTSFLFTLAAPPRSLA